MAISIDVVRETYPKYQLDTKTSTKPTENIALVSNDIQTVGDSLHLSTAKVKQEKTQEQSGTEKQSNTKKWLKIAGVTAGVVLSGVALAYLFKRGSSKIAGDSLEKLKQIDDFNVLKDLKMCQNLSPSEKKSFWNMLVTDDKQIFLGTLSDNKPMALLSLKTHNPHDELPVNFLKKLKLGKNFDFIPAEKWDFRSHLNMNTYFINKKLVMETIKKNKDIYTDCLKLSLKTSDKKIYDTLIQYAKKNNTLPDDLLGITLGFPKYDSMIFNLEHSAHLNTERTAPDYIKQMLAALHSSNNPYKNLEPKRFAELENAVKNINQQNLIDIPYKGSFHNELYSFINFCDDAEELKRIATQTENYKKMFGIV